MVRLALPPLTALFAFVLLIAPTPIIRERAAGLHYAAPASRALRSPQRTPISLLPLAEPFSHFE